MNKHLNTQQERK